MLKLNRRVSGGATTLADEIKRLSGLFSQSHDAVIAIDDAQHIVFANQMAVSMFGWQTEGDLIDKPVRTILPGKNAWLSGFDKGKDSDVDPSDSRSSHLSQVVACRADGAHFNIYLRVAEHPVQGNLIHYLFLRDLSLPHDLNLAADNSVYYDQLTGLPKREALIHCLNTIYTQYVAQDRRFLMMEIGIDQMRAINSTFGMEDGNSIIRLVGDRLAKLMCKWEFFGRGSGDRFSALVEIPPGETAAIQVLEVQKVIAAAFEDPFEFGNARVAISATAGGLEIPLMADEPGMAIRYADMAYYEAKNWHRGEVYLLTEEVVSRV